MMDMSPSWRCVKMCRKQHTVLSCVIYAFPKYPDLKDKFNLAGNTMCGIVESFKTLIWKTEYLFKPAVLGSLCAVSSSSHNFIIELSVASSQILTITGWSDSHADCVWYLISLVWRQKTARTVSGDLIYFITARPNHQLSFQLAFLIFTVFHHNINKGSNLKGFLGCHARH